LHVVAIRFSKHLPTPVGAFFVSIPFLETGNHRMSVRLLSIIHATRKTINRLTDACRKNSRVYREHPKAVAKSNRSAKRLLNILTDLEYAAESSSDRIYFPPS
jgi:hypothetical protein